MTALRLLWFLCILPVPSCGTFYMGEPVVHWYEDQITVYTEDTLEVVLRLAITHQSSDNIIVRLHTYAVGISIADDITIPKTVTIPAGRRYTDVIVQISPNLANKAIVGGNRLLRVRVEEILEGKAVLGDYHYNEIIDVHLLGPSTTECHSGSFATSRISVPEDVGTVYIPFVVNTPFSNDFEIGYKVDLHWFRATHHAEHEVDYRYHVSHNHQGDDKYVTLPAGATSVKIPISIIDDSKAEETEQFIVRLDHKCLSPFMNVLSDYVIVDIEDNDVCTGIPPGPHEYYQGTCYFLVSNETLSADNARDLCRHHGGELIAISDTIENAISYQLLPEYTDAWIGAERNPNNSTVFLWNDGSHVTYESWANGEPDLVQNGKDCVFLRHDSQTVHWITENCDGFLRVFSAICEKTANAKC